MAARAVRWSCARCEVSVGRIDREPALLPASWSQSGDRAFCLACSRALAGEAASATSSREELVRLRRTALIEFEIGRAPEAPNRTIAQACRTSAPAVAAVRNELDLSTAPDPD